MSVGYVEHSRTRYMRTHYEIFDYRKEKEAEQVDFEDGRRKREEDLEERQQERRDALEELIAANTTAAPTSRYRQEVEAETALKRLEKERERERKAKRAEERAEQEKQRARISARENLYSRQAAERDSRIASLEKQSAYNQIERDRRRKEREAKEAAKYGGGLDSSSDSEEQAKYAPKSSFSKLRSSGYTSSRTPNRPSSSSRYSGSTSTRIVPSSSSFSVSLKNESKNDLQLDVATTASLDSD